MKKTFLYTAAAAAIAAIALIAVVGCNNGEGGYNEGLNGFLGSLVNRGPDNPGGGGGEDGKYPVTVIGGSSAEGSYASGHGVVIVADRAPEGRRFDGWTTSSEGVSIINPQSGTAFFIMPPNAVTVTANFAETSKFRVEYNGGGNDGGTPPVDDRLYESGAAVEVKEPGDLTKEGCNFSGWRTGDGVGVGQTFIITQDVTLYARWMPIDAKTFYVTVVDGTGDGDNEAGATVTVKAGSKEDQKFDHWTSEPEVKFANARSETTTFAMPANDVTVTAVFIPKPRLTVTVISDAADAFGSGYYDAGDKVTIYAGTVQGMQFTNWTVNSGGEDITLSYSNPTNTFDMPATYVTVTANFIPAAAVKYQVTVVSEGTGSEGGGEYTKGRTVVISAGTASGKAFKNWTTESSDVNFVNKNAATTSFIMPEHAVTVTAVFEAQVVYRVTVESEGTGSSGGGDYAQGRTVNISAGTASGKAFKNWTTESSDITIVNKNAATTSFVMPAHAVTVTAVFEQPEPVVKYLVTVVSEGTDSEGGGEYTKGRTVVIYAGTAPSGKVFQTWTTESSDVNIASKNAATTSFIMPEHAVTVTAVFGDAPVVTPVTYTLTVDRNPSEGGTTDPEGSRSGLSAGEKVNISATASSGYRFANWTLKATSGGGVIAAPNETSTNVTVNGNVTVTAYFTPLPTYTLKVTITGGGKYTRNPEPVSGADNYLPGTSVTVTAIPDDGWEFNGWSDADGTYSSEFSTVTIQVNKNWTLKADFVRR